MCSTKHTAYNEQRYLALSSRRTGFSQTLRAVQWSEINFLYTSRNCGSPTSFSLLLYVKRSSTLILKEMRHRNYLSLYNNKYWEINARCKENTKTEEELMLLHIFKYVYRAMYYCQAVYNAQKSIYGDGINVSWTQYTHRKWFIFMYRSFKGILIYDFFLNLRKRYI